MNELKKWNEKIILSITAAIMLPFFISTPIFIIGWIVLLWLNRSQIKIFAKSMVNCIIFCVYAIMVASYHRNSLGMIVPIAFIAFGSYFTMYNTLMTANLYERLMKVLSISSSVASGVAIFSYIRFIRTNGYDVMYILIEENTQFRAESFLFNANYFGLYLILCCLVTFYWMIKTQSKKIRLLCVIILVLQGISLLLTASRMVIPALIVSLFVYFWLYRPKYGVFILLVGSLGLFFLIINPHFFPRFSTLMDGFADRIAIWKNGGEIFKSYPLTGRGAMSYLKYYYLYTDKADMHAHQLLIDTLANYGIIGLTLLMVMIRPWVFKVAQARHSMQFQHEWRLIIAACVAVLTHGLVDVSIMWMQTGYVFLAIISFPFNYETNGIIATASKEE